jgi:hypothetical protein
MSADSSAAYAGVGGAKMAGTGRIDQAFTTVSGQTYQVSGRIRIDQQTTAPSWGGLRVQITASNWQQLAASPSLTTSNSPAGQWTEVRFTFTATGTTSRITFENFSGGGQFNASADDLIISQIQ